MKTIIVTDCDLGKPTGDTVRVLALASEVAKSGVEVNLVALKPFNDALIFGLGNNVKIHFVTARHKYGVILNQLERIWLLTKETRKILKSNRSTLYIETSPLAGYFALVGLSNYVLDMHAICFDEVNYNVIPRYIPRWLFRKFTEYIEKLAVRHANRTIVVSNPMKKFILEKWKLSEERVIVIPNGYFEAIANNFSLTIQKERMISFVGVLAKWAAVDKVIEAANILKDSKAIFYIVGDGPCRQDLESIVKRHKLSNIIFTGFVPIDRAYEIIAQSQVVLSPMDNSLSKQVCCAVKQIEYMALGKAMVIDGVGEIAQLLKKRNAAMVCQTNEVAEFAENIAALLNNPELRNQLSANAKMISQDYSWQKQGEKLINVLKEANIELQR